MTTIKQIIVEHDGVLCVAVVPQIAQRLILSALQANESGIVQLVKLPDDVKLVELSKQAEGV